MDIAYGYITAAQFIRGLEQVGVAGTYVIMLLDAEYVQFVTGRELSDFDIAKMKFTKTVRARTVFNYVW